MCIILYEIVILLLLSSFFFFWWKSHVWGKNTLKRLHIQKDSNPKFLIKDERILTTLSSYKFNEERSIRDLN